MEEWVSLPFEGDEDWVNEWLDFLFFSFLVAMEVSKNLTSHQQ